MNYRENRNMDPSLAGLHDAEPTRSEDKGEVVEARNQTIEQQAIAAIEQGVDWFDLEDDVREFFESHRVGEEGYQAAVRETQIKKEMLEQESDPRMREALAHLTDTEKFGILQMYEQMVKRWERAEPATLQKLKAAMLSVSDGIEEEDYDDNRIFSVVSFGVNARVSFPKGKELFNTVLDTYLDFLKEIEELDNLYKGSKVDLEKCKQELRQKAESSFFANGGLLRLSAAAFADRVGRNYEHVNAQATAFATVFKNAVSAAKASGETIDFKEFADTELEVVTAAELQAKVKETIVRIFTENRQDNEKYLRTHPETGQTWMDNLAEDLKAAMEAGDKTEFYMLKHGNDIVGFIRFDDLGNHKYHVASFNVNSAYKDGKIGGIIFRTALELKGPNNHYLAEAEQGNPAMSFYTEGLGFTAGAPVENYKGFGNTYIPLERGKSETKPEKAE